MLLTISLFKYKIYIYIYVLVAVTLGLFPVSSLLNVTFPAQKNKRTMSWPIEQNSQISGDALHKGRQKLSLLCCDSGTYRS